MKALKPLIFFFFLIFSSHISFSKSKVKVDKNKKEIINKQKKSSKKPLEPKKEVANKEIKDNKTTKTKIAAKVNDISNNNVNKDINSKKKGDKNKYHDLDVEKDFDTIRGFYSYDPSTDTWSRIDEFKPVEIIEDINEQRPENYVYKEFWAYDDDLRKWNKVDIRDYGYKLYEPVKLNLKWHSFFKNLAFDLRFGSSFNTYTENFDKGASLFVRGSDYIFMLKGNEYKHNIFKEADVELVKDPSNSSGIVDYEEIKDLSSFYFRGKAFSLPFSAALHYTAWNRLRLGITGLFEIDFIKEMKPNNTNNPSLKASGNIPFYTLGFGGLLGFKIVNNSKYSIVFDTDFGFKYNKGNNLNEVFSKKTIYRALNLSVGISYERNIMRLGRFITRLSSGIDFFKQDIYGFDIKQSTIPIRLDVGLGLNFGKRDIVLNNKK